MSWFERIFRRQEMEDDLAQEIDVHLEERVAELAASGVTLEEARAQARREFGNPTLIKEDGRDLWRWVRLENFTSDVRYATRTLAKVPGFAAIVIVTLALGIGANTAIFSVVNAVLIRSLPVKEPDRLAILDLQTLHSEGDSFSYEEFERFRDENRSLAGLSAVDSMRLAVQANGQPDFILSQCVSGEFAEVLGIGAALGRTLNLQDDQPNAAPVAFISNGYWARRFGSDPNIIGRTITLKDAPYTIVGVAPESFRGIELGDSAEVWVTMAHWKQLRLNDHTLVAIIARLKDGVTSRQAAAELTAIDRRYAAAPAASDPTVGETTTQPLNAKELSERRMALKPGARGLEDLPDDFSRSLFILMCVVGLILLVGCANVANLLLSHALKRRREIAMRLALGAPRFRLFQQLLTESVLLAGLGGALGLALASAATRTLVSLLSNGADLTTVDVRLDARVLWFSAAVCVITGVLFGLAPACWAFRVDPGPELKANASTSDARSRAWSVRDFLVVSQIALSVLVLVGSGLLVRSLANVARVNAGFRRENILIVPIYPTVLGYEGPRELALYQRLQEKLESIPDVRSASLSRFSILPGGHWSREIQSQASGVEAGEAPRAFCNPVAPRFFETMGIPMILGRDFSGGDGADSPRVAVVSQSFGRGEFGDASPLGRVFWFKDAGLDQPVTVVGVVQDVRTVELRAEDRLPTVYIPIAQAPQSILGQVTLAIRTEKAPTSLAATVRDALQSVEPELLVFAIATEDARIADTLNGDRSLATLSGFFGVLALLLACLGLYGVIAYAVTRRAHEIGVRLALGAQRRRILGMVVAQGLRLTAAGLAIGVVGSVAVARLGSSLLFGVSAADPLTFAIVAGGLTIVAMIACVVPARRAMRVDPMTALRCE